MKTILYIDDNKQAGMLAKIFLEKAGYTVTVAENTERARQALGNQMIDMILTDLGLPGEDGLTFYKWLQQSEYKAIPVLIVSGHALGVNNELARHKEIFVQKPILFPELIDRINKILNNVSST